MKQLTIKTFTLILLSYCVQAQSDAKTITIGTKEKITSRILNESREIYLYRPEKLNPNLPLVIVFDGESLFASAVSAVRFMNYSQELPQMPEALVVGIPNTDRNRDMPIPQTYGKDGEKHFALFLEEELIPMLRKTYSLNGHVILIGHSQGGLFVSYLLSLSPQLYTSVIALDAPLNVDGKVAGIKQKISQLVSNPGNKIQYASLETAFGWGMDWETMMGKYKGVMQGKYPEETHESMPHKAIYDGLRFMYQGFAPPKKDMKLIELLHHYKIMGEGFGFNYEVPERVLLASANRKIMDNRKAEAVELLNFSEEKYGVSDRLSELRLRASKLNEVLDPLVEFYLNHPRPSASEIEPYVGRWTGELMVPGGQPVPTDFEVRTENGRGKMIAVLPWPPFEKVEVEILFVDKDGSLVFGRKNRGAGLIISTGHIGANGTLIGDEKLIGFTIPEDVPVDVRDMMKFTLANPNTFDLRRVK